MRDNFWPMYLATILAFNIGSCHGKLVSNRIPKASAVQAGYVIPSDLEIKLDDVDHSGEKETLLIYKGARYLLLEKDEKPYIAEYSVEPAKVVPK